MKIITSRQNQEIKEVSALKSAKERKKQQRFVAEGMRTVKTIATHMPFITLYATQALLPQAKTITDEKNITCVSDAVMEKLSGTTTPPGIVGLFAIPPQPANPLSAGIVLANITNPGNMGTLIRTAAAMNLKTVVIVEGADPWSPKVIQACAGTIANIDLYQLSWQELYAQKNKLELCALVVKGGRAPHELSFEQQLIVVGNEATGLPEQWVADCTQRCTLPMPGNTESLNAAVAGSIALYLLAQQQ